MKQQPQTNLADGLWRLADDPGSRDIAPRLRAAARTLSAPVTVAVYGRGGVGVSTTADALTAAGVAVVDHDADIEVRVLAEVVKPEDRDALADAHPPTVLIFNKADLAGLGAGGPMASARRRCRQLSATVGVPIEPLDALVAVAAGRSGVLDEVLVEALRTLVAEPADLSSPDAFVTGGHALSSQIRHRLVAVLDIFGIAHAVAALRRAPDCDAAALRAILRRVSGIDEVCALLDVAAAEVRYRRSIPVLAELQAMACADDRVAGYLVSDDVVLARMAQAAAVVGARPDRSEDPSVHTRRAVWWRDYARGPVSELHRSCAGDIVRGSLRLLVAGGSR